MMKIRFAAGEISAYIILITPLQKGQFLSSNHRFKNYSSGILLFVLDYSMLSTHQLCQQVRAENNVIFN